MRKYSMAEVRRATHDFAEEGLLGEGRYGGVFRGERWPPLYECAWGNASRSLSKEARSLVSGREVSEQRFICSDLVWSRRNCGDQRGA
jgi:hypothetical protein